MSAFVYHITCMITAGLVQFLAHLHYSYNLPGGYKNPEHENVLPFGRDFIGFRPAQQIPSLAYSANLKWSGRMLSPRSNPRRRIKTEYGNS